MNKTLIIAEAGVNHNGDLNLAMQLVETAAKSGADIIKFQTFNSDKLVTNSAKKTLYQEINDKSSNNQYEMLKKLELNEKQFFLLKNHCKKFNIEFLSTAFDEKSLNLLEKLELKRSKIPSGEITNLPFLQRIGSYNKEIILSTGMSTLGEIEEAIDVIENAGTPRSKIIALHCTSEYPAPINEVNLKAMLTISNSLKINVGYSDHTEGISIAIAAVAMGAKIIEKHLTLDRSMEGPDHIASIEPKDFKEMSSQIRKIESALGDGLKQPTQSELKNILVVRKSLVAAVDIKKGDLLTDKNIAIKRPGTGISPMNIGEYINKKAAKNYLKDELID